MLLAKTSRRQRADMPKLDRRGFQRVKINVLGRFMLEDRREYPCQVRDMSPGNAALITPVQGREGERVIAYIDHLGRVEGKISRQFNGGFAIILSASAAKRDKMSAQLTWLANRHELNLPEDRRHDREVPQNSVMTVTMLDGTEHKARVLDMSLSGAAINFNFIPEIGTELKLGKIRCRVVRIFDEGVAVEFASERRQGIE